MGVKTVEEIYEEMLAGFRERTGMELGNSCDLAARMYALAAQVYALQVQTDWVARQAFPQTAQGDALDCHAFLRGLERKQALSAQGVVRFTAGETAQDSRTIPQGTVCMTTGLVRFETLEEGTILPEELTVDVPVQAVVPGSAGNVAADTIVTMAVAPAGIARCTNPQPCTGGADQEEDEALRSRVLETFRRLPNGANAAYYQQQALSFEQVAAAAVVPRPRGVGTVDVVVASQSGVPEQELLQTLTEYFQARREIAVDLQVRGPETVTVDVALRVTPKSGWSLEETAAQVEQGVREWFTGELLGQNILRSALGDLVYHCQGVANYEITAPAADVKAQADVLPVLGSLTVEELA